MSMYRPDDVLPSANRVIDRVLAETVSQEQRRICDAMGGCRFWEPLPMCMPGMESSECRICGAVQHLPPFSVDPSVRTGRRMPR